MVARIHREISLYELVGNIDTIHYLFVCMCVFMFVAVQWYVLKKSLLYSFPSVIGDRDDTAHVIHAHMTSLDHTGSLQ